MPIGLITGNITYIVIEKNTATPVPTNIKTEIEIPASVKPVTTGNNIKYPGQRIDLKIVIELTMTPDTKNHRIKYLNSEYKILGFSQSIGFPNTYTMDCQQVRTVN